MTDQQFVEIMILRLSENFDSYEKFLNLNPDTREAPYWDKYIKLYHALSPEYRDILTSLMKRVAIDTLSTVFGVVDGSSYFDESRGDFELRYNGGEKINGELQDYLLSDHSEGEGL